MQRDKPVNKGAVMERGQKRFRKSKFDPYIAEITKYVIAGMTVREIAELLQPYFDEVVDESAVYAFMRSRGIQSRVTMGGTNLEYDAPRCSKCEQCWTVHNTTDREVLLCLPAKRLINRSCKTSPMWCIKRGENLGSRKKMDSRRI